MFCPLALPGTMRRTLPKPAAACSGERPRSAAVDHWINQGMPNEGRAGANEMDVSYYLSNYADLQAAFGANYTEVVDHWIDQGLPNEGRQGSLAFDVQYYLATYADVKAAFGTNYTGALDQWIDVGMGEGRKGAA
jgi:uncharacterized protein YaeQ